MNMSENANMIQFLQMIGWTGDQINNFMLCIEGRVSLEEGVQKHAELNGGK